MAPDGDMHTAIATSRTTRIRTDAIACIILAALSMVVAWLIWNGPAIRLSEPIYYAGDGLFNLTMIQQLIEGTWVYTSSRLGAPFGSVTFDYPIPDTGSLFVLKALGVLSHSAGWALNVYYFLGFAFDAIAAYFVMRYLGLRRLQCFSGAFIFTMLPFHFFRMFHVFYTWYFTIPIFTWYSIRIWKRELDFFKEKLWRQIADALLLLIASCFGVYYAFFGCVCMAISLLSSYVGSRSLVAVRGGIVAIVIVFAGVVANVAPTLIYQRTHGPNPEVAERIPAEAEIYGLQISQLLLPSGYHRSESLRQISEDYSKVAPFINENISSPLGFIGSIGFLALLGVFLMPAERRSPSALILAILTLGILLFCMLGGFSSLFAMLVSTKIRAWNRASIFIGFFAVTMAMLIVQTMFGRCRSSVKVFLAIALCAFAVWDQGTPFPRADRRVWLAQYESDKEFTARIEAILPHGSMIYQIPYMPYPEGPTISQLTSYDQAAGYVNSTSLRWSFGTMNGRAADLALRKLSKQPLEQQLRDAREMGFAGIWVDRRGYQDHGAKVEAQLAQILGTRPAFVSSTENQSFFVLHRTSHQ